MSPLRHVIAAFVFLSLVSSAQAGPLSAFTETTLQTNLTDPDLVNPWGMSSSPTGPFWISDNGTGLSTLYNTLGVKQGLVVSMPAGSLNVTGQVFNGTSSFNSDAFLFANENGTITGWRGALGTIAETLFTVAGASYKGLAVSSTKDTLYAANFAAGRIDVFSSAGLTGSYVDPTTPAGYAPFNIQNINGKLYVTYALRGATGDDVAGAGNGFVSVFDPITHTFTRLVTQGALNSPWGLAIAPADFGSLAGDLLVGNFGDGTINAFDTLSGALLGTLADASGVSLVNDGLWGLDFGNGGNGGLKNALYITAGPNNETGGLFARIDSTTIPEPSSLFLTGAGLAMFIFRRRKVKAPTAAS
jgi:uncharacterized protein (TIGR03118 family)